MGTGWRRAFCTTIPRERSSESDNQNHNNQKQVLIHDDDYDDNNITITTPASTTPNLRCHTFPNPKPNPNPNRQKFGSNPSSPRSPFAILRNTLRLSRNGCGVCMQSVKTGQRMAVYTAECSHAFHFPCIVAHVRKLGTLICPVCNVTWKDNLPLLSFHKNQHHNLDDEIMGIKKKNTISTTTTTVSAASAPVTPTGTNRIHCGGKRNQQKQQQQQQQQQHIQYSRHPTKQTSSERCYYDDDEPLHSHRSNPISEVVETDHSEEFKGFFPTPKNVNHNVDVKLSPEAALVSTNLSYETYVVALRVTVPPSSAANLSPDHRAPVDLVAVLDMSGTMVGTKFQMLKKAMRLVISSLGPNDRLSIVTFSYSAQRLLSLKRMTDRGKESARWVIDGLACGQGNCCVTEALRISAKVLADRREKNPVTTIILLSNGQDDRIVGRNSSNSTRFAHIEIPIHSSKDAFAKSVVGLLRVVVQDLRIQLGFAPGSAPAEIMAVYSSSPKPTLMNYDSAQLGDLYADEKRELLIEVKVPTSAMGYHQHVMSVRCRYNNPINQELVFGREQALPVPRPCSTVCKLSDHSVQQLKNLFVYTRAVAESNRLVDHNDFTSAHHLLSSARALVLQSSVGSASTNEYVQGLEAELAQVHWRRNYQIQVQKEHLVDENGDPLTPMSAWRAAERLAKVAIMKKSLNRSFCDLYGFENARF